ncbi:MAG: MBL fold metallo-hydrolase [Lachnospiraceae bacterium]|nr:MBL fold metallo-hydrolase [Lachnospiraceae bacterium]
MVQFHAEKISEHATRIYGLAGEQMYLVEGAQKAALIDTGSGAGSLRQYVESLTDRPVIVLVTHGHVDHAMGAPEFDTVYMSRKDDYIYVQHCELEVRKRFLSESPKFADVTEEEYIPVTPPDAFLDMEEGDVFDLGGISIEIYACPGHTRGSLCMLIREERTLITGDACNGFTFLFDAYSTGLSTYEKNLQELKSKTAGKFDRIYLSHGPGRDYPAVLLDEVLEVCEDIKNGNVDDVPFESRGRKAHLAKALSKEGGRLDGKIGNIVYNKERIAE